MYFTIVGAENYFFPLRQKEICFATQIRKVAELTERAIVIRWIVRSNLSQTKFFIEQKIALEITELYCYTSSLRWLMANMPNKMAPAFTTTRVAAACAIWCNNSLRKRVTCTPIEQTIPVIARPLPRKIMGESYRTVRFVNILIRILLLCYTALYGSVSVPLFNKI